MSSRFSDQSIPGGIVHNPATPYAREMAKWEMGWSNYGPPGRPRETVGHQPYPAAFYKMSRSKTNGDFLVDDMREASGEAEATNLESLGYRQGRVAAIAYVESLEQMVAVAAAERAFKDKSMGEKAQAEARRADDATSQHVAEVPVTPIRKRGRPAKVKVVMEG